VRPGEVLVWERRGEGRGGRAVGMRGDGMDLGEIGPKQRPGAVFRGIWGGSN
jgi:hypothetical protein